MLHFARLQLAQEIANAMQGRNLFGDDHNGLFLAAPRRTGKSTFLQSDLLPVLQERGVVVIYVDLWADKKRDPASLIADAIGKAIDQNLGLVAKTAKGAGLSEVSLNGWMKIDTTKIGKIDGLTLTQALQSLHDMTDRPIAIIVDEAQHALTSDEGEAAMTALKAARDTLNTGGHIHLMLVMSGSDRDKLLRLVNTNGAPFYGSEIRKMPLLGKDFVDHVKTQLDAAYPDLAPVDAIALTEAFQLFGERPQFFSRALSAALNPLESDFGQPFAERVVAMAKKKLAEDEAQMESEFLSLRPLEQFVLWRILEQGPRFRPYDSDALLFYHEQLGKKVTQQNVQAALNSLRDRDPALVWKSARGEYAADDAMMHKWFSNKEEIGAWPPKLILQKIDN